MTIEVSLLRIKLNRKTADVPWQIDRTGAPRDGGEPRKDRRLHFGIGQEGSTGNVLHGFVGLKEAVRRRTARMNDPLRDPFVVEMRDLLTQNEVFEQGWPTTASLQRVLII